MDVIRLVEIGQQALVAAGLAGALAIVGPDLQGIQLVQMPGPGRGGEVHQGQGIGGDLGQAVGLTGQAGEDPGPALGGLVEEEALARVLGGQRLGHQFGFLDLEGQLDAPLEGGLQGGHGRGGQVAQGGEDEQVAVVLDEGDDALVGHPVEHGLVAVGRFIGVGVVLLAPGAGDGIDIETQLVLVLAPAPAAVDAPDPGGGRVGQTGEGLLPLAHLGLVLLHPVVRTGHEAVGGLQLVTLALPVLIVDGDAVGAQGLDGFDPVQLSDPVALGEQGAAVLAAVDLGGFLAGAEMAVTALAADQGGEGGQLAVAGDVVRGADVELGADHPVHAALMVDEAAWAKLRQGQETRATDHAALVVLGLAATASGYPGHQGQAGEVIARQEALAGQETVAVEVGVLGIAALEQDGVLAGRVTVATLGIGALGRRGGMAFDDLVGHVHLGAGGVEQHPPALQRRGKALGRLADDLLNLRWGKPVVLRQIGRQLGHDPGRRGLGPDLDLRVGQPRPEIGLHGFVRLLQVEQGGDAGVQPDLGAGQPDGMQMTFHQVAVGQIQGGGLDDAMHHVGGMVEKPLVMGAQGRAIGDDQGLLAGATGAPAALGIVGRRRGDVAQIDGIQRGDVDPQLHGRGAEHDGEPFQGGLMAGIVRPVLAVLRGEAEALFEPLPAGGVDLGRVLLGLEVEEGVVLPPQELRHVQVKLPEEGVGLGGFVEQPPLQGRGLQAPARQGLGNCLFLGIAPEGRLLEQGIDQFHPFLLFPGMDLGGKGRVLPQGAGLHLFEQTGAGTAGDQVGARLAFVFGAFAEDQGAGGFQLFVRGDGPALVEVLIGAVARLVLLGGGQVAALQAQPPTHLVEDHLAEVLAAGGCQGREGGMGGKEAVFRAERLQAAIADAQQAELIQVGVVETPAPAQITDQAVADDVTQGTLRLFAGQAHELGGLEVFAQGGGIQSVKTQGGEDLVGQVLFGEESLTAPQGADQAGPQRQEEDEVVEVPSLEGGILTVVGEAQEFAWVGQVGGEFGLGKELAQGAEGQHGRGRGATLTR